MTGQMKNKKIVVSLVVAFLAVGCGSAANDCATITSAKSNLEALAVNRDGLGMAQLCDAMEKELNRIEPYAGQTVTCNGEGIKVSDKAYIANTREAIARARQGNAFAQNQ